MARSDCAWSTNYDNLVHCNAFVMREREGVVICVQVPISLVPIKKGGYILY